MQELIATLNWANSQAVLYAILNLCDSDEDAAYIFAEYVRRWLGLEAQERYDDGRVSVSYWECRGERLPHISIALDRWANYTLDVWVGHMYPISLYSAVFNHWVEFHPADRLESRKVWTWAVEYIAKYYTIPEPELDLVEVEACEL